MADTANFLENAILNYVRSNYTIYAALYTVMPTDSTSGTEVTLANGYSRQVVTFNTVSGGSMTNNTLVNFGPDTGVAWGTVVGVALVDAATSGNILYYKAFDTPKDVGIGDRLQFDPSSITVEQD